MTRSGHRPLAIALAIGGLLMIAPAAAQQIAATIDIAEMRPGTSPIGFQFARTGGGATGQWVVVEDPTAERGKANQAIIGVLCDALDLRRSQIELLSGETAREKRFLIRGVAADELAQRIAAAVGRAESPGVIVTAAAPVHTVPRGIFGGPGQHRPSPRVAPRRPDPANSCAVAKWTAHQPGSPSTPS